MKSITSIILIIVSIAIFFLYVDPQYKKVQQLQFDISENNKILEVANRLKSKKTELNDKFNQISQSEKTELAKLLPDTVDNVRLIIDINNIAEQFGIVIRDININTKETDASGAKKTLNQKSNFEGVIGENAIKYVDVSKIGVISFSFSVSAKYEVFLEFLDQLEESLRLVDIRNIEVTRGTGVFYDYHVTFDTYWLK